MNFDNFKLNFNFISSILFLSVIFLGGYIWADTNGVWYDAQDVRPGIFGSDQLTQNDSGFSFINNVNISNTLNVTNYLNTSYPVNDSNVVTKLYVDLKKNNFYDCAVQGLLYNGTGCQYAAGISHVPDDFSFKSVDGAELSTYITSNQITITGVYANLTVQILSSESSSIIINGVDTNSKIATIEPQSNLSIKLLSANDYEISKTIDIKVGDLVRSFNVKTKKKLTVTTIFAYNPTNLNSIGDRFSVSSGSGNGFGGTIPGLYSDTSLYNHTKVIYGYCNWGWGASTFTPKEGLSFPSNTNLEFISSYRYSRSNSVSNMDYNLNWGSNHISMSGNGFCLNSNCISALGSSGSGSIFRVQIVGNQYRLKSWTSGTIEPYVWNQIGNITLDTGKTFIIYMGGGGGNNGWAAGWGGSVIINSISDFYDNTLSQQGISYPSKVEI